MSDPKSYTPEEIELIKTEARTEGAEPYLGMEKNYNNLLGETKEAKRLKTEAEENAATQRLEGLEADGKYKEVSQLQQEKHSLELGKMGDELSSLKDSMLATKKSAAILEAQSGFLDASKILGQSMLSNMIEPVFDGTKVTIKYKDLSGETISVDDAGSFNEYLKGNDAFKPHMKGFQMDGAGSVGSIGKGGGAVDFSKMSRTEKTKLANSNPELYQKLSK